MTAPELVGLAGVGAIVTAYLMLQTGRLPADRLSFSAANAAGAAAILFSLAFEPNLPAALIEIFWLLISLYGVVRAWRRRGSSPPR